MALELDFEHGLAPAAWIDVQSQATPAGITLEPGVAGLSARFDGSGAAIDITHVDRLPLAKALTVELQVKASNWKNPYAPGSALESIVSHSDDFSIAIQPSTWKYRADLRTTAGKIELNGGDVRFEAWQHVALVLDDAEGLARLYVDGRVVDQREVHGEVALRPGIALRIGTWFSQNQAFCGSVDTLRIWQRALSLAEIGDRGGKTPKGVRAVRDGQG